MEGDIGEGKKGGNKMEIWNPGIGDVHMEEWQDAG